MMYMNVHRIVILLLVICVLCVDNYGHKVKYVLLQYLILVITIASL